MNVEKEMTVGMKRACLIIFVALVAAVLVLPTTAPLAKSLGTDASPTVKGKPITPGGPYVPPTGPNRSGDGDDGDGDDLGGIRGVTFGNYGVTAGTTGSVGARIWWMYFWVHVTKL